MRNERPGHTLSTTALVNECYLRLIQNRQLAAEDRTDFMALASQTMRRLLVDHARSRNRLKRGTPGLVTTLLQPIFLGHFPTSESVLPRGFVSSLMTTDRFAGVGVSGWSLRRSASVATTEYFQTVMNISEVLAPLVLNYKIPEIEVATLAPPSVKGPSAHARATMTATYFRADGTKRAEETVFEYSLFLIREFSGKGIDAHSWEMTGLSSASFFEEGNVFGIRHPEIEGRVPLDLLDAGEHVEISYELIAEGATGGTPEVGYHAQIGDPFNLGSGGFSVSLAEPVASDVPEPATVLLLPAGLFGALFAKKRKRGRLA